MPYAGIIENTFYTCAYCNGAVRNCKSCKQPISPHLTLFCDDDEKEHYCDQCSKDHTTTKWGIRE